MISEAHLERLRNAGLLVSDPFVPFHVSYPDGVIVAKPASVKGNFVRGYDTVPTDGVVLDSPTVVLTSHQGKWFVSCQHYAPGPGPGEFVNEWATGDEAVGDILDFYFGDPARMALHPHILRKPRVVGPK